MANLYKRYNDSLVSATPATLFTVPEASVAIIRSIWICNPTGSAATVVVSFAPQGTGSQLLTSNLSVNAGDFYDVIGTKPTGPLVLEGSDILRIQSSVTGVVVVVSALFVDRT